MKILVIDGCGRKGNTWKLTGYAMRAIKKKYPDTEFDEMVLAKINLPMCIGCSNCFRLGNEKCPHYSIMKDIIERIENADGVIVCSSTYNWSETGYIKNLFDHLCFMLHRPYFYKGKALVITTAGGTGQKKAAKRITGTLSGIGFNRCYTIAMAAVSWNDYKPGNRAKRYTAKISRKFAKDVLSGELHSPKLMNLMPYNIMRGMGHHYTEESEYPTADGTWWTDPERGEAAYFPEVKMSSFKKKFGNTFFKMGKMVGGMRKMKVTYRKNDDQSE